MSNSWPTKPLGELLSFLTTGSRGWARYYRESGDLFLRIQNVGRNQMMLDDVAFVMAPDNAEARRTRVQSGDVLLSVTADLGRTGVVPEGIGPAYINQHLAILRVQDVHPSFLSAFLASPQGQKQIMGRNRHAVKSGLNFDDVRSFRIPLPPLAEQRRIAEVLDRAEALRAKRRAALAQIDSLTQSLFLDLFGDPATNPKGWTLVPLGALAEIITKGESPKWQGFEYQSDGVLFVTSENVRLGSIDLDAPKFVPHEFHRKIHRSALQADDILVNLVGASIGRSCVFPGYSKPANVNQAVGVVRLIAERAEVKFVAGFLLSEFGKRSLLGNRVDAARANISLTDVRKLQLQVPPIELQREFARRVTAVEKLKTAHRASLAELDALFATLQHRAFKGEL